jgi:hypothetical protein
MPNKGSTTPLGFTLQHVQIQIENSSREDHIKVHFLVWSKMHQNKYAIQNSMHLNIRYTRTA